MFRIWVGTHRMSKSTTTRHEHWRMNINHLWIATTKHIKSTHMQWGWLFVDVTILQQSILEGWIPFDFMMVEADFCDLDDYESKGSSCCYPDFYAYWYFAVLFFYFILIFFVFISTLPRYFGTLFSSFCITSFHTFGLVDATHVRVRASYSALLISFVTSWLANFVVSFAFRTLCQQAVWPRCK